MDSQPSEQCLHRAGIQHAAPIIFSLPVIFKSFSQIVFICQWPWIKQNHPRSFADAAASHLFHGNPVDLGWGWALF